jgi:hypothetical protein
MTKITMTAQSRQYMALPNHENHPLHNKPASGAGNTCECRRCPARSVTCHRCAFQLVCRTPPRARPVHLEEDDTVPFVC